MFLLIIASFPTNQTKSFFRLLILGNIKKENHRCWIGLSRTSVSSPSLNITLYLIQFHVVLWISIIFILVTTFRVVRFIKATEINYDPNFVRRLKLYPAILLACWLFPTIHRIYVMATGEQMFYLLLMQSILPSLQGLFNFLFYGLNSSVISAFKTSCHCCFGAAEPRRREVTIEMDLNEIPNDFYTMPRNETIESRSSASTITNSSTLNFINKVESDIKM